MAMLGLPKHCLLSVARQASWSPQDKCRIMRRLSDVCDEDNKFPPLKRSKMNVEERLGEMLQNQNIEKTKNIEKDKETLKPFPFKIKRRSLSPMARIQNLIDDNEKKQ